jgi:hypothetical protein
MVTAYDAFLIQLRHLSQMARWRRETRGGVDDPQCLSEASHGRGSGAQEMAFNQPIPLPTAADHLGSDGSGGNRYWRLPNIDLRFRHLRTEHLEMEASTEVD